MFKKLDAKKTGLNFKNEIIENDSINPIDLEFLYNGGGVAVGDFNRDSLPDLYFTASTTSNKLYLNKGDFSFEDITTTAGVTGEGRWANAASVVDINDDGWPDIYVCNTLKKDPEQRRNLLYINKGLNEKHMPVFQEMAADYGLADTSHSVHAAFFDYDNDGDLDMYLVTTKLAGRTAVQFNTNGEEKNSKTDVDKLFRADWDSAKKHPVYTDVSMEANIMEGGYGLGISIVDINRDGWKDIYVTNDFYTNDLLYINNHNGTFTNKAKSYFKHTSQNAMGNDVADINNDGLADVLAVDMNPEDNFRKKKNMNPANYYVYQSMMFGPYNLQYVRNTLQLNQGPGIGNNDTLSDPVFSEVSFMADIAQTDWSWNASIADMNNDGYRDIIITNGYPKDVTDHDFAAFRTNSSPTVPKQELIDQIPSIKVANYAFTNSGTLKFVDVTKEWGMAEQSFSSGAVYVDLDNDNDLDYVINNINEKATVYENTTNNKQAHTANYLKIKFDGGAQNRNGLGAIAELYYKDQIQSYENSPYRGYLSTVSDVAFFGLGNLAAVDSMIVYWPNGKCQVLKNVSANQMIYVKAADAMQMVPSPNIQATDNLLTDVTQAMGVTYRHQETDVIDFDIERLLTHKLSQYGPGIAAGDVDGNGLDDLVIGGNNITSPTIMLQQSNGTFVEKHLPSPEGPDVRSPENMGILLFDVDMDGDLDLYLVSGSNEFPAGTKNYQDRLFINNGKGNFTFRDAALPQNFSSKSCVKAADYDGDGDLDLFVGGRVLPGSYPMPVNSIILRNDTEKGVIKFSNVTELVAPTLLNIGLVCDALWTDFDNDGKTDLIVAGEWMPIKFLKNSGGKLDDVTVNTGVQNNFGLWNSIVAGDFDNDGDVDYIVANLGENSFYKATEQHPLNIYAKDFDGNGSVDPVTTMYLKDEDGVLQEFPVHSPEDMKSQLPGLKKRFLSYKEFGHATFSDLFTDNDRKGMLHLKANYLQSSFLRNMGNGKFSLSPLPDEAQLAPIYGMVADDLNDDGNLDIVLVGNDYGTEVTSGRYDALNGLVMLGDGAGGFRPRTIARSGFLVEGDGKALVKLRTGVDGYLMAASQNKGKLKIFRSKKNLQLEPIHSDDQTAIILLKNGKLRKEEFYFGNSFCSQSARFINVGNEVKSIQISSSDGKKRIITPLQTR